MINQLSLKLSILRGRCDSNPELNLFNPVINGESFTSMETFCFNQNIN